MRVVYKPRKPIYPLDSCSFCFPFCIPCFSTLQRKSQENTLSHQLVKFPSELFSIFFNLTIMCLSLIQFIENKWEIRYSAGAFGVCFEQWFARKIVKLSYLYSFRKIQTIPLFESEITLPSLEYNSAICPVGEMIVRNQRKNREGNHLDWVWSGLLVAISLCKHTQYPFY